MSVSNDSGGSGPNEKRIIGPIGPSSPRRAMSQRRPGRIPTLDSSRQSSKMIRRTHSTFTVDASVLEFLQLRC